MEFDLENKVEPTFDPKGKFSDITTTKLNSFVQRATLFGDNVLSFIFACFLIMLVFLLITAVPIVQIIMGSLYKNQCPINYLIPIYLIVTGVVSLCLAIIMILKIIEGKTGCIICLNIVLGLFCLAWLITGSVWVAGANKKVQYSYPSNPTTYCQYTVYHCAYATHILNYFIVGGLVYEISKNS